MLQEDKSKINNLALQKWLLRLPKLIKINF